VSRRAVAAAAVITLVSIASPVLAGPEEDARVAYERAAEAFARKSYAEAAAGFAIADDLQPNPVALESALKAAILADDPVLGMKLVERADGRPPNAAVQVVAKRAREKFEGHAGRLTVTCPDERGCTAKLGGVPIELGKAAWVRAGTVEVEVTIDGAAAVHAVEVAPGGHVQLQPPPPPRREAPPPQQPQPPFVHPPPSRPPARPPDALRGEPRGIHPAWIVPGAVATAALVGVTIWSGIDTLDKHDAFERGDDAAKEPGQDAQLRTNLLLGATVLSAGGTVVTGIFIDWGGSGPVVQAVLPRAVSVQVRY
jgi:hypothetical protein